MVFKMKAYDGWTELSPSELKVKCAPYKEIIKETWARVAQARNARDAVRGEALCEAQVG